MPFRIFKTFLTNLFHMFHTHHCITLATTRFSMSFFLGHTEHLPCFGTLSCIFRMEMTSATPQNLATFAWIIFGRHSFWILFWIVGLTRLLPTSRKTSYIQYSDLDYWRQILLVHLFLLCPTDRRTMSVASA